MKLQEYFNFVYEFTSAATGKALKLFDVKHFEVKMKERAIERLKLERQQVFDALRRGLLKIEEDHDMMPGDYMIISGSLGIKLPLTIQHDKYNHSRLIGLLPTLLLVESNYDLQRDYYKNILIESKKGVVAVPLVDSFIDYYDNGQLTRSYETIKVI